VSVATSVTGRTLYSQSLRAGIRDVEQMSCQTGPEDSHGGCGGDVFRQTVPDTSSSDWKSSVADGRQSGAADDQR